MSNEIAIQSSGSLPEQIDFARALADASLLPRAYQKQPANILLAIQYGEALGIPPIQAINGVHVIEGKPTASADLIGSLVRRAGHKLRIRETGAGATLSVTATLIRADDPDFEFAATWDMAKAREAGLTGKAVWKQYPGQMLRSRAITEVCRQGAGDALYGVVYTPEELGADEPERAPRKPANVRTLAEVIPEPDEPEPDGITDAQTRKMGALMREAGLTDRADALAYVGKTIGREVASRSDLTKAEASLVIDRLAATPAEPEVYEAELIPEEDPA